MYFDPIEAGKRIKAIREAKGMTQMGCKRSIVDA